MEKIEATLVTLNRLRALKRRLVLSWILAAATPAVIIGALCGVAFLVFFFSRSPTKALPLRIHPARALRYACRESHSLWLRLGFFGFRQIGDRAKGPEFRHGVLRADHFVQRPGLG